MGNYLNCSDESKNIHFEICHEITEGNYLSEKRKIDKNRYLNIIQTPNQTSNLSYGIIKDLSQINLLKINDEEPELDFSFDFDNEKNNLNENKNVIHLNFQRIITNDENNIFRSKSTDVNNLKKNLKKRELSSIHNNENNCSYDSSMYILFYNLFF